jgi:hypothetical protein
MHQVEGSSSPFHPDTVRFHAERTRTDAGLYDLWAKCFRTAIYDFARDRVNCQSDADREAFRASEIYHWFFEDRDLGPGSFQWLCSLFSKQPEKVRDYVLANSRTIFISMRIKEDSA